MLLPPAFPSSYEAHTKECYEILVQFSSQMVNFELNLVQLTLYELDLNLDHFLTLITVTKHLLSTYFGQIQ